MTDVYTYKNLEYVGRLANQCFEIAATCGIAWKNKGKPVIKPTWEYRPYFSIPDNIYGKEPVDSIDGGTEYFQELQYFEDHEEMIREFFAPSDLSLATIATMKQYDDIFETMRTNKVCSVHVRRGDYVKYPTHFPLPTVKYYNDAMDLIRQRAPDVKFFFFSDDIEWCKQNFSGDSISFIEDSVIRPVEVVDRKVSGPPSDQYDMFVMSMCDYHIIANSTFSWWGAWLSVDTEAIYPSVWFGSHPFVRDIPWRKMIPETWVEVAV